MTQLKTVVLKAIPNAKVSTVTTVNPGLLKNDRKPKRKAFNSVRMGPFPDLRVCNYDAILNCKSSRSRAGQKCPHAGFRRADSGKIALYP